MKILFFSHYFPPEGNAPASRTYENCKRWVQAGHEVTVVTCAPNVPNGVVYDGYRNRLCQRQMIDGVKVIRVWTYMAANKGIFRRILNYVSFMLSSVFFSLFLKRPDVIIATSPQFFCGWAGVIVSQLRRTTFILEIRDIWPEGIIAVGALTNKRIIILLETLEKWMYALANTIVAVGDGYKNEIVKRGIDPRKIAVIPNGADIAFYRPCDKNAALIRLLGLENKFICSFNGTIGMTSGLTVILRAARILKKRESNNICFLLVGDGAVREELQRQAEAEHLENVLFAGSKKKKDMPKFLSIADVCLVHLKRRNLFKTTLPSKLFEALAMGKPVILGVEGHAAQVLKTAQGGICIEPENEEALIKALETLVSNPDAGKRFGRLGREYVLEHFNRDTLATHYLDLIKTIVENPNRWGSAPTMERTGL